MNDMATAQVDPEVAKALKLGEKPRRGRRWWLAGIGVVILGLILTFLLIPKRPQAYDLGTVQREMLDIRVTATGTLRPLNQVEVGAEVSGRIDTVEVDFNDRVERGQVLAQINTDQLVARLEQSKAGLAQAQARLAEARASLSDAQLSYNRIQPLARSGSASKANLDSSRLGVERAEANVMSAEAQVALSQAALDADQASLEKATIKAPTGGIVLDRLVEPGQTVAASFQTPILFKLAEDLARMELAVDIDEADIGQVKAEQKATFTVDAYPGRPFSARITSVHNAPKTEQGVVTYEAILLVDNPDLALKPGMTATAEILVASIENALTVPSGALRFVPIGADETPPTPLADGSGNFKAKLWMPAGKGIPRAIEVIAGASDGERTAIVKGDVKAGDKVITDTVRAKRPGGFGPQQGR